MRRRSFLTSVAVLAAVGLTGCTSSSGPKPTDAAQTPTQLLEKARDTMNATSGVHVNMVGKDIPKDSNAVLSAKGDATPATPAWQGNVNLQFNGTSLQVPVVAIKDDMWAQIFGSEQKIDPAKYKVPNPASFFDKEHGLGSLLGKVTDAKFGDEKRVGKVIVQTVSGSISAADVHSVFSIGPQTGKYDFTFGVDEATNQLLTMTINGPFYTNANASYDVSFDSYGQTVDIKAP